jgi:hypothetical protein
MLYPLDRLPIVPVVPPSNERDNNHVGRRRTTLTATERDDLQCAYLWLQAYNCSATMALPPPSPQPTYAELYYMLQYFHQIQILVGTLPSCFDQIVIAHAERYAAAVEVELPRGARSLTYYGVLRVYTPPTHVALACADALAPPSLPAVTPPLGPMVYAEEEEEEGGGLAASVASMEL